MKKSQPGATASALAQPEGLLQVYGALWCGDCRRARKFLDQRQIAYQWIDVEEDPSARQTMQGYNGGLQRIPTIVTPGGAVLVAPTKARLAQALGL